MSNTVRFVLGDEVRELSGVSPTQTVLEYLRTVEKRCGTKEGCAEGDCGACTVALGEADPTGKFRYKAVNACIQFVPTLHGKHLITIEDLKRGDGTLHPAQEAMVRFHGSQCGFCTPGIVMALYTQYRSGVRPSEPDTDDLLAGNLCRCTGYGPIIKSATEMFDLPKTERVACEQTAATEALLSSGCRSGVELRNGEQSYFAPRTSDELAELVSSNPSATILAGGTDIGLWVTKLHRDLSCIIYVGDVEDLKAVEQTERGLEIPAAATYAEVHKRIGSEYRDLGELIRRIGSTQIRNLGTVCGNIANGSPIGDMPPAFIALEATVVLRKQNKRREIPLEDYFVDYGVQALEPGEFVERVILPLHDDIVFKAYKISKRFDQDISAVCGAFALELDGSGHVRNVRICYGGMAGIPKRAKLAETSLRGKQWNLDTIETAMAAMEGDFTPLSDMRASAAYRTRVAQNLLMKCYLETQPSAEPIQLAGSRSVQQ